MKKWVKSESVSLKANPALSNTQAKKCDSGMHTYTMFKPGLMGCLFCGARKGGLPPVTAKDLKNMAKGQATTKGTLTAKKTKKDG